MKKVKKTKQRKRPKTSLFRGVSKDPNRNRWISLCRAAHFKKYFRSELEAAAHYNAVARLMWPEDDRLGNQVNNFWKIRTGPPYNELGQRLIQIDQHHGAVIDDNTAVYTALKDMDWFIRDGRATVVARAELLTSSPWVSFTYKTLEELVKGGPCVHLNRKLLDCRRENLVLREDYDPKIHGGHCAPCSPAGMARHRAELNSPRRIKFREKLALRLRWEAFQRGELGGFWQGEEPYDPRLEDEFRGMED